MLTVSDVLALQRNHGHVVFDGGAFDLNLVLLRRTPGTLDAFDDLLLVLYRDAPGAPWTLETFACTADPGKASIERPTRRDGTAVLDLGQHRGAFTFGRHKGRYACFVPTRALPVTRYRSEADYAAGRGAGSTSNAIQIHRASATRASTVVGPWSEGCVVLAAPESLARLLALGRAQVNAGHGDRFSLSVVPWSP
jgi:hypothetical protein